MLIHQVGKLLPEEDGTERHEEENCWFNALEHEVLLYSAKFAFEQRHGKILKQRCRSFDWALPFRVDERCEAKANSMRQFAPKFYSHSQQTMAASSQSWVHMRSLPKCFFDFCWLFYEEEALLSFEGDAQWVTKYVWGEGFMGVTHDLKINKF